MVILSMGSGLVTVLRMMDAHAMGMAFNPMPGLEVVVNRATFGLMDLAASASLHMFVGLVVRMRIASLALMRL
jgi:citrate lyase alpha subunit